jgi:hypothetical protein
MFGKQAMIFSQKTKSQQDIVIEIRLAITLTVLDDEEPDGTIAIDMAFEPFFPEIIEDKLYQRLRNGVHGGIALSNSLRLPPYNILLRITELSISPSIEEINAITSEINLGYLLEISVSGVVETLLRGAENLRTGKQLYYDR